jgi:hypothetical protein
MAGSQVSIDEVSRVYAAIGATDTALRTLGLALPTDPALDAYVGVLEQELCLQLEMERSWGNLVHSMVANCSQIDNSLNELQAAVDRAVNSVMGRSCADAAAIDLPPTLETSFDSLVDSVERTGLGRPNRALPLQRRR